MPTQVLDVSGKDVLLVERFDRDTNVFGNLTRRHMLSAMTLLILDEYAERAGNASYLKLADVLRTTPGISNAMGESFSSAWHSTS